MYILHSHIIAFVPSVVVKDTLAQNDPDGKRGKWIAIILEYDIEIRLTKLIKGQGLEKLMAESNFHALNIIFLGIFNELDELATPMVVELLLPLPSM